MYRFSIHGYPFIDISKDFSKKKDKALELFDKRFLADVVYYRESANRDAETVFYGEFFQTFASAIKTSEQGNRITNEIIRFSNQKDGTVLILQPTLRDNIWGKYGEADLKNIVSNLTNSECLNMLCTCNIDFVAFLSWDEVMTKFLKENLKFDSFFKFETAVGRHEAFIVKIK